MTSPIRWMWVWVNSGRWWWTGRPGVLRFMGSQRVGHNWATELNWTELNPKECRGGKNVCPFFLLENSRSLSPWGPLDFLSTCLGLTVSFPPFLLEEFCCQGKGASFSFHNYFLLFRGMVPKLLRQHIILTLILRVSDPGAPSNSWRKLWHS